MKNKPNGNAVQRSLYQNIYINQFNLINSKLLTLLFIIKKGYQLAYE